ncbi:PREDICTED: AAA-ATPase At3g28510-like isoform X3 [Tarenaya hassleriana]|uniref:AAA-ATPase At3g28510-like isoform X3 n=1 Tax=Tarenaya hassleriana TaxID=28532 RepID=UPI00053C3F63|nr:PREDICTED: AAA-ATPase At3g28510-like isoform X3 [Tarenaya hassleriana]
MMREVFTVILTIFYTQILTIQNQYLGIYGKKLMDWVSGKAHIRFNEYTGENLKRSEAYDAIQNYLSEKAVVGAKRLKANESSGGGQSLLFSIDDDEEIADNFSGVKVKWSSKVKVLTGNQPSYNNSRGYSEERRFFTLTFPEIHREFITKTYVDSVIKEGKEIGVKNRKRKLYTNNSSQDWFSWREGKWSSMPFKHPATFDKLAMDPVKKQELMDELEWFQGGKDYYEGIGKPWKRGYLLHGPPGTGKSTMISAMANFLKYDVYDLELTNVKDNSELKRVLLDTKSKSLIVIEDIDCSLDLTAQRSKKEKDEDKSEKKELKEREEKTSKVTLSGLLNSIDGLWSACSDEKVIVFTTNHLDKLDPTLVRRGRMDNHIEMSYCRCGRVFDAKI